MAHQTAAPAVPPASAGPISDKLLEKAIAAARAAQDGHISDEDGTLFLLTAAPIMEECLQWRRRMGVIRDLADAGNVILMPWAR